MRSLQLQCNWNFNFIFKKATSNFSFNKNRKHLKIFSYDKYILLNKLKYTYTSLLFACNLIISVFERKSSNLNAMRSAAQFEGAHANILASLSFFNT